jgi:hypothetical protein
VSGNKVWICSAETVRAIGENRELMIKIHQLCMKVKLELGEISPAQFASAASQ